VTTLNDDSRNKEEEEKKRENHTWVRRSRLGLLIREKSCMPCVCASRLSRIATSIIVGALVTLLQLLQLIMSEAYLCFKSSKRRK